MTHGDDKGLRLPPHIAPIQVLSCFVRASMLYLCASMLWHLCVWRGADHDTRDDKGLWLPSHIVPIQVLSCFVCVNAVALVCSEGG